MTTAFREHGRMSEQELAGRIGGELDRCRERGLEELDLRGSSQRPKETPELDQLAQRYSDAKGLALHGRIAQIRRLLRDSLPAYADHGNDYESQMISRVFFDPEPEPDKRKRPGELLEAARSAHGLDPGRFRSYLDGLFAAFADFLIGFVADAVRDAAQHTIAPAEPNTAELELTPVQPRSPFVWVAATVAVLVLVGGVLTAVLLTRQHSPGGQSGQPTPASTVTPTPTSPPVVAGKTYSEQEGGFGAPTFTDPHNPSVSGPKIPAFQRVEVTCKVLAPTIPSVSPDGYWYRIAGGQWDGKYAAANTFQNGDSIGGAAQHNTDFNVPDCPS
jgi:hypothetical protein